MSRVAARVWGGQIIPASRKGMAAQHRDPTPAVQAQRPQRHATRCTARIVIVFLEPQTETQAERESNHGQHRNHAGDQAPTRRSAFR
jgi:hypothetical protein